MNSLGLFVFPANVRQRNLFLFNRRPTTPPPLQQSKGTNTFFIRRASQGSIFKIVKKLNKTVEEICGNSCDAAVFRGQRPLGSLKKTVYTCKYKGEHKKTLSARLTPIRQIVLHQTFVFYSERGENQNPFENVP